jgi:hypothetical protein
MNTLLLFFFHIGFVVGAFLLLIVLGTIVFYVGKKQAPDHAPSEIRFREYAPENRRRLSHVVSKNKNTGQESDFAGGALDTEGIEFEDIQIVLPLSKAVWSSKQVLSNSPSR